MEPPPELAHQHPSRMSRTSRHSRQSRVSHLPSVSPKLEFTDFTNYPSLAPWHPSPSILTACTDSSPPSPQETVPDKTMTSLSRTKFRVLIVVIVLASLICLGLVCVAIQLASKQIILSSSRKKDL